MNYLILVGGKGTRLKSIVKNAPKPLAPLSNGPFLEFFFDKIGFSLEDKIHLLCGYKYEAFEEFQKSSKFNFNIIKEDKPLGTGGAIRNAFELLNLESAVIFNGDCIQDIDLSLLNEAINKNINSPLMVLRHVDDSSRFGGVKVIENRIIHFAEKGDLSSSLINSGIYYLTNKCIKRLPENYSSVEKDFFEKHLDKINLRAFIAEGNFIDIGIPEDYLKAKEIYI
tara:strand:- start:6621 stop:7295 length:675 start_codon:yes stop_codon:yes gene_type:complete